MQDQALSRIHILFGQGRYSEAEKILLELLPSHPENPTLLSYLAETKLQNNEPEAAHHFADAAFSLAPNSAGLLFLKARIHLSEGQNDKAALYLQQAIQLDPEDPDLYALQATIQLEEKRYEEALASSNQALSLDAEHLLALNARSTALLKLKRSEESFTTIEEALREDPDNAYTHSNFGWLLLEKGERKKALEHFREALRQDPGSDMARTGMAQALKAANPLYRLFLNYAFWLGNLTRKYQWGVIIGFFLAFRILRGIAAANESLQPVLYPLLGVLGLMAFSTWIITPLSNLFLRLSSYGRFLLSKEEIISSGFVGISLAIGLAGVVAFFATSHSPWLVVAAFGISMMVPLGSMLNPARKKNVLVYYTAGMTLLGLLAIGSAFLEGEPFNAYGILYILAFAAFQWVANYILIEE